MVVCLYLGGIRLDTDFQGISRELLIETDSAGVITAISSNCFSILGYQKELLIGKSMADYTISYMEANPTEGVKNLELIFLKKDGNEIVCDAVVHTDHLGWKKISLMDITRYKEIELWENRFRNILENTKDIVYLYDVIPEMKFVYVNQAIEASLGVPPATAYADAMYAFDIAHPNELDVQYKKISKDTDFSKSVEVRMRNSNGEYLWFEDNVIPFFNSEGELIGISGFCRNIQDRKELEQKLQELSYHDSLTGLFSNNYYNLQEKRLNEEHDCSIGVIMCDLDNLKRINDTLGHVYGDKLLINFANLLKSEFGKDSVLIRKGGDEFVVMIENASEEKVIKIYYEIQKSMDQFNEINLVLPIKASIGWAYSPTSLGVIQDVFRKADDMMYANKINKRK